MGCIPVDGGGGCRRWPRFGVGCSGVLWLTVHVVLERVDSVSTAREANDSVLILVMAGGARDRRAVASGESSHRFDEVSASRHSEDECLWECCLLKTFVS